MTTAGTGEPIRVTRGWVGSAILLAAAASYYLLPAVLSLDESNFAYTFPALLVPALPVLGLSCATGRSVQREVCWLAAALGVLLTPFTGPLMLLTAGLYALAGAVTPSRDEAVPV